MNLKRPLNKLIFNIVVLNILVFLLTWIIGTISFLIYQNNYLGSFKDDFTTSVNLVEQSYLNFKHDVELDDIWKYSSDYNLESLPAYDLDSDLIIANASELNISELSEDNLMLVMIDHVNRLIAYTKIEDVFKINEFSKRIVLLNQYDGYIYYTNDESLTNQTFYYYLSERNASFVRGLFDQTNNFSSINYKFDQRNTLINFSYPVDNLILVELVNATLFNTIINSIKIILFVLLGFGGSLYLVIKYLLNHRFDSSKKDITSILKYNDRNLLIWVYADGAIIDYNLTVSKTFNVGTKVKHLDNLFLNDEINYELYIRQQISFIVNVNDQIYEFTSILQKNGYLLVGRMATSSSIEVNKYREIAYSNLVTNLPNQLSLYESYPSFNLRDEPYLVGLSIVDYEHIETLLGLEFTNELLNEIKNYLKIKIGDLPIKLFHPNDSEFILVAHNTLNFKIEDLIDDIIASASIIEHRLTKTKVRLKAAILPIGSKVINSSTEELYYMLIQTLQRVLESPIFDKMYYDENIASSIKYEKTIEKDLKKAIANDEFVFHLQPIYQINQEKIIGFEALLRWNNPKYFKTSPSEYLKVIEDNYLMIELNKIILQKIVETAKILKPFKVSLTVNISIAELNQDGFITSLANLCKENGVEPSQIGIEITENSLIYSEELARTKIKALRSNGFKIYLDDFGTGYSSLSYLRYLKVDVIKIDRSFIEDIETNENSLHIYQMIVDLIKKLGLEVVSEGVETDNQRAILQKMGVEKIQGFIISPGVALDKAIKLLSKQGG